MTETPTYFKSFPLKPEILSTIESLGFSVPTPIQNKSLLPLLKGLDVIGQSQTGSGKTLAFALPILQQIDLDNREIQALILGPTRELCAQVTREIRSLGRGLRGLQVLSLVGGEPLRHQKEALSRGAHIAVGTPGRVLDLLERAQVNFKNLKILILDEADRLLDMGFSEQVAGILDALPQIRQTALFSATFPETIQGLSRKYQKNPQRIIIESSARTIPEIEQILYESPTEEEKLNILFRILQQHSVDSTLIFCNQKQKAAEIGAALAKNQVKCATLHGDLEQRDRDRELALFRNGSCRILVATDVAARGLDIENLDLVVNFDLPSSPEIYIHRIGRTGRAGRQGISVSIGLPREAIKIFSIEEASGVKLIRQKLGFKNQYGLSADQHQTIWKTLKISGGRKDKLRAGDILGALTGAPNALEAANVGQIEIHDQISYVAVVVEKSQRALKKLLDGRIKGRKFRVSLVEV